ncbi:MAG TPA: T9SS type A sorting domain-containing protein, partial [Panacibacter sp.]|nr:T9SS type A sorting domain-containing protein [Panacibacter sp.]
DGKPEIMVSNFNKISVLKNIMQPAASISLQSLPAEGQADAKQVSLQIFPNPASEYVTVQHPASGNSGHIKLVDLMGKVIKVITADKDALQTNMGLKGLLPGSYIIIWSDGKNTGSKILLIK